MPKAEKQRKGHELHLLPAPPPLPPAVQQLRVASGFSQNRQATTLLPLTVCVLLLRSGLSSCQTSDPYLQKWREHNFI